MARFNRNKATPAQKRKLVETPNTVNFGGGDAFTMNPRLEMASIILTSMVSDKFYESTDNTMSRLFNLVNQDPEFAAKASLYARNVFGMRSITHVVGAMIAKNVKGEQWTRPFFRDVAHLPKDATEILYLYLDSFGKPIPNSLKRGLADALRTKYDAYQIAKYRAAKKDVKLVDIFNLTHPSIHGTSKKYNDAVSKLMKDELRSTETWESKLSASGGNEEKKKETWEELLNANKLGYMALLRNLRNINEQAPESLDLALHQLVNPKSIEKSLLFPFNYMTAYNQFNSSNVKIQSAINNAMEIALGNIPTLEGSTLVAVDNSGSMGGTTVNGTLDGVRYNDIANLFGAAIYKSQNPGDVDLMAFATNAYYAEGFLPSDSLHGLAERLGDITGGATYFNNIFKTADKKYDRIIIISDMQALLKIDTMWSRNYGTDSSSGTIGAFNSYKDRFNCDPKLYSIDLAGYGTLQFPEQNQFSLAGYSDKIFDIMYLMEGDKNGLINTIDSIEIV